jgi:glucose-1-phosphate adenylyltransferase
MADDDRDHQAIHPHMEFASEGEGLAARAAAAAVSAHADALLARGTMAMILAGGRGARLGELTDWRCKPSVPFGGKFRIVDFALSNCVNSGVRRIGVLTQYKAQSLIRHVQNGWGFLDGRLGEFVELMPAQQRVWRDWYRGTADAVYQNLDILRRQGPRYVLVLAGDHVYKMDYSRVLAEHVGHGAELTVGCVEVPIAQANAFGVMAIDGDRRVRAFEEKPQRPAPLPERPDVALASMGIYVFDAEFLYAVLARDAQAEDSAHDFGKDVIPRALRDGARVYAHHFADSCVNMVGGRPYWRDVGTIDAYWAANMDLIQVTPDLNLYDEAWPIWTHQVQLPPAKFVFDDDDRRGMAVDSMVSGGCLISGSLVRRSLLFSNVRVHSYCTLEDAVVLPNVEIGRHSVLKRVVIDKYCKLVPGTKIGVDLAADRERFHVTEQGVVLVTPEMLGQRVHHAG